jgi:hypothetical protein
MGWCIGTFGHKTQVAEITVINNLPVILLGYTINLKGLGLIHQIKERGKGLT